MYDIDTTRFPHAYPEQVAQQERERALPSSLGTGCCLQCGRPIAPPGHEWKPGDCAGGYNCNMTDEEYEAVFCEPFGKGEG